MGSLTLVVGDPGIGKSHLSWDWLARHSAGASWPDGEPCPAGRSILLSGEDNLEVTVVPNLIEFGADLQKIEAVVSSFGKGGKSRGFNLKTDCERLEDHVLASAARLVVIDPLNAFQTGINPNQGVDTRLVTTALAKMAERTGAAVVVLHHFNKKQNGEAMYRPTGSIDLVAAARSVIYVVQDPSDPSRRGMFSQKLNIARAQEGRVFHLGAKGKVEWDDGVTFDPQQAMMSDNDGVVAEAKRFLLGLFEAEGATEITAKRAQDQAKEAGVSLNALGRAKVAIGATSKRVGGSNGYWVWSMTTEQDAKSEGNEGNVITSDAEQPDERITSVDSLSCLMPLRSVG
jgi:hypothetical protein